jgi:hypothetical protein
MTDASARKTQRPNHEPPPARGFVAKRWPATREWWRFQGTALFDVIDSLTTLEKAASAGAV